MKYNCNTCLLTLEYECTKIANKTVGHIQVQEVVSQHVVNIAHAACLQDSHETVIMIKQHYKLHTC